MLHIMQPYLKWIAGLIPDSIAPNMLTFIGLLVNMFSFGVLIFYRGINFDNPSPSWVYLLLATCFFIYYTLDMIDGDHARRLGLASPLG